MSYTIFTFHSTLIQKEILILESIVFMLICLNEIKLTFLLLHGGLAKQNPNDFYDETFFYIPCCLAQDLRKTYQEGYLK